MPDFSAREAATGLERDIPYGEHGERNMLDVWRRRDVAPDAKSPVLFQVHGGAWVTGMKEGQAEPLMGHLAERGWVCVAPNYRLSPTCHVARAHRRREAGTGLGEAEHRPARW